MCIVYCKMCLFQKSNKGEIIVIKLMHMGYGILPLTVTILEFLHCGINKILSYYLYL